MANTTQWHKDHPGKHSEYSKRKWTRLRQKILDLYGGKCNHCSITDPRVLQLDHVNGNGYAEKKKLVGHCNIYRRALKYKEDYQLLCANCNWIKRAENKEYKKHA